MTGTTVDATTDADEPSPSCRSAGGSVWYAFDADEDRPVVVALDAAGDLDAFVDVFARERSQLVPVDCAATNRRGAATLELDAERGTSYLIRVAALPNSARDRFALRVVEPDRPATFPGPRLPRGGVSSAVDRIANADDAWSVRLQKGRTYRINFVSVRGCASVDLYASEGAGPARSLRCDRHTVFVPSSSRAYTLLVRAPRGSRVTGSPTGCASGRRRRTTPRPGSGSPTTRRCAEGCRATSSTRSTSTASRSRARAGSGSA